MKQEDINRIRELLDAYAEEYAPEHMRHFADEVSFLDLTTHPIMLCRVISQFDERHCLSVSKPYKGEKMDAQTVRSVNVWDYKMRDIGDEWVVDKCERIVAGSHHLEDCVKCQGKGRLICPTCHGTVEVTCGCNHGRTKCSTCGGTGKVSCSHCDGGHLKCTSCSGTGKTSELCRNCSGRGTVTKSRMVEESYNQPIHDDRGYRSEVRYRQVKKYYEERCPVCNGKRTTNTGLCRKCRGQGYKECTYCDGSGKLTCSTCEGKGNVVCRVCGGTGLKACRTCYGQSPKGTVACKDCAGSGKLHNYLCISQSFYYEDEEQIFCHDDFFDTKVAHLSWEEEADNEELLGIAGDFEGGDIYHDDADVNALLKQMAEQQARHANPNKRLIRQGAWVTCFYAQEVCYQYEGKDYGCIILGNHLYMDASPVTDYIENVAEECEREIGRQGSAAALKNIEEAMQLGAGDQERLQTLWYEAKDRLEKKVKLGEALFFWPSLLFLAPLVYKFYAAVNPVIGYASIVKDPSWRGHDLLPLTQAVIFVLLYGIVRFVIRIKSQYNSTYGTRDVNYVLAGMGRMGLAAAAVFAVLLLLNYLGLSWLTTWIAVIIRYLVNAIL